MKDPELHAMLTIAKVFAGLDPSQRGRVLEWLNDRFLIHRKPGSKRPDATRIAFDDPPDPEGD